MRTAFSSSSIFYIYVHACMIVSRLIDRWRNSAHSQNSVADRIVVRTA